MLKKFKEGKHSVAINSIKEFVQVFIKLIEDISATSERISASVKEVTASVTEISNVTSISASSSQIITEAVEEQTVTMRQVNEVAVELSNYALQPQSYYGHLNLKTKRIFSFLMKARRFFFHQKQGKKYFLPCFILMLMLNSRFVSTPLFFLFFVYLTI